MTLDLEFVGEIEILVNNERKYTLNREEMGKDIIGARFLDKPASVKVITKSGAQVKKATAKIYEY